MGKKVVCTKESLSKVAEFSNTISENLNNTISAYDAFNDSLSEVDKWVETYKENLKNKEIFQATRTITGADGKPHTETDWIATENNVVEFINGKIKEVKNAASGLKFYTIKKYKDKINKMAENSNTMNTAIVNFEGFTSFSLENEIKELNLDKNILDSIAWSSSDVENADGKIIGTVDVIGVKLGDQVLSLNEAVNCVYTDYGITTSGAVELASISLGDMSQEDYDKFDQILLGYVEETGATTSTYAQKGFYSVATTSGISAMYTDATGLEYDESIVEEDYNSIITAYASNLDKYGDELVDKINSGAVGSAAMFGLVGNAIANKGALTDDEKKKAGLDKYIATDEDKKESLPREVEWPATTDDELLGEIGAGGSVDGIGIDNLLSETEGAVNLEDSTNDSLELDPDESLQTDYEADRISDIMDKLGDSDLPANIDPETRTPEEIDSEARDEYFEQNEDTLYEEREQHIEEYQSMDESEKQNALEELGYSKEDAAKLVAAPAAGQTAYVYGKFNQSLSNASNNIAAAEGVNNFVSGYDSKNTLTNVTNKTANVDLTPTSENVQNARQQLSTAKGKYDESVNKANDAIDKASTAKDKYNKVLKNIQDKNGEDPKNWTDEQVGEYNEAATMYNDAVEEAQRAAEEVESAKQSYNQEKEQYQAVYDKWRDEAEEDVGMTGVEVNNSSSKPDDSNIHYNDTSSSSGGGQAENIDDSSISLDSNSSTNTGGGQVNGASQSKPGGNSGVTVDDSGLSIGDPVPDNGPTNNIETGISTGTESVSDSSINIGDSDNVNDNIMDEYPVMEDGKPVMTEEVKPNTDGITEI